MIGIGDKAPDFELQGDDGSVYTLGSFAGKKLVLYFYPKDNTSGCTVQAQEFTSFVEDFADIDAVIVGVSPDSIQSHRKFKEKAGIKFLLLSDPKSKVAAAYGAYAEKVLYGKVNMGIIRSTFAISPDGVVSNLWRNVRAKGHAQKVISELS